VSRSGGAGCRREWFRILGEAVFSSAATCENRCHPDTTRSKISGEVAAVAVHSNRCVLARTSRRRHWCHWCRLGVRWCILCAWEESSAAFEQALVAHCGWLAVALADPVEPCALGILHARCLARHCGCGDQRWGCHVAVALLRPFGGASGGELAAGHKPSLRARRCKPSSPRCGDHVAHRRHPHRPRVAWPANDQLHLAHPHRRAAPAVGLGDVTRPLVLHLVHYFGAGPGAPVQDGGPQVERVRRPVARVGRERWTARNPNRDGGVPFMPSD
jgi:hypothetical protein